MKFRREAAATTEDVELQGRESRDMESREDLRELAEALGLYRSAMTHLAERSSAHPRLAVPRTSAPFRLRFLLGPALGAALAAGLLLPLYGHLHHSSPAVLQSANAPDPSTARAAVDDTVLMNQIDSQLSETVPDALAPLTGLSARAATTQSSVSETKQ